MSPSNENVPKNSIPVEFQAPEHRVNLRFPIAASVVVTENKSGMKMDGRISDLGLGGCYVDAMNPLPVGTDAQIQIIRGCERFEAQAKVVYSQSGMGMGLAFVSAQPEQVQLFQR